MQISRDFVKKKSNKTKKTDDTKPTTKPAKKIQNTINNLKKKEIQCYNDDNNRFQS